MEKKKLYLQTDVYRTLESGSEMHVTITFPYNELSYAEFWETVRDMIDEQFLWGSEWDVVNTMKESQK